MAEAELIRLLIVDDEPLAREKIREMAKDDPELEIIGECFNGEQAIAAVRSLRPDILLLDVQMPVMGGFEVLETLAPENLPLTIFVTAYDQYAVRAFDVHAFDYLLKPFDRERFRVAIQRAKEQLHRDKHNGLDVRILALLEQIKAKTRYQARLVVKTGGRVYFLETDEIEWIEAEGNYVNIHTAKKAYLLRETISSLASQLEPKKFIRIHRSTIVNISSIRELQPWTHGEYQVILHNGKQLMLSRNFRENLQHALVNSL